ncbi:hypothetical protein AB1Y20_014990 [Prymnesium parvum]|uniref:Uncharacterized protein n=1 Tax=Prymnesium parvum TaxID=97485 RepID=A0AB34JZA1_PRYPA
MALALLTLLAAGAHNHPRAPLLGALYPTFPDEDPKRLAPPPPRPPLTPAVNPNEQVLPSAAAFSVVATIAVGLLGLGVLATSAFWSAIPASRPLKDAAERSVLLTLAITAAVPILSCLSVERDLSSQSVALYLSAMGTAAAYALWLVSRLLRLHSLGLPPVAHACVGVQVLLCGGLGWILTSLKEIRSAHRARGTTRCGACFQLFVPPPRAPVVACPFCGTHNAL